MNIPRRELERNLPDILARLKQNPHEAIGIIDKHGEVLFFIAKDIKNLSTTETLSTEQIETTSTNLSTNRREVFQNLKKQFQTPDQIVPPPGETPPPNEVVGRKDKKYRVLGQSPYGRDDIKYTTSYGA